MFSLRGRLRTHTVFTKDQCFFFFLSQLLYTLHKIIDRIRVLESSLRGDSNTRSQHMILWRNIEKKSLLMILIPTPILLYVRLKSWVTFVRRCFRDVNLMTKMGARKS